VKPIAEWTEAELRALIDHPGRSTWPRDFPDEVLRLRAMQSRHNGEMEAYCRYQREAAARAEKAEAERDQLAATVIGLERSSERLIAERNAMQGQVDSADARAERAEAELRALIDSYRDLREKCNDAYLQRDAQQVRANTAERKAGEWRAASFAVDAQLRHAQTERDTLNVDAKAWLDNCRKERERAERAEAELGKLCPHRTSESNGSYWVCCSCGEYLRKANQ
jgi:outer membrane murein-binding lipoprotein Lpp